MKDMKEKYRENTGTFISGALIPGAGVNRNYKDTVFRMLFKQKETLLHLYNALSGTSYEDPEALEIVTLENAIYMGMKNDLAFIMDCRLNLYEHQSTLCPNMPLRHLMYVADEYEKIVDKKKLLSSRKLRIPTPGFIMFYNGREERPEKEVLRLSDLYQIPEEDPNLELKVTVLNINPGKNEELKEKCHELWEYVQYVECVRHYEKKYPLNEAAAYAVEECIKHGILKEFLIQNRSEVMHRCLYEYDEQEAREVWREDGRIEGEEIGIQKGIMIGIRQLVGRKLEKNKTADEIAGELEMPLDEVKQMIELLKTERVDK